MTQETKLNEPVQVGLWYEQKCGHIIRIKCMFDGTNCFEDYAGDVYLPDGQTTYYTDTQNLIRCLGADPFKQVDISKTETTNSKITYTGLPQTIFTPAYPPQQTDYPTQFERILTAVLPQAVEHERSQNGVGSIYGMAVKKAIALTQEAIKQLKEIEGA